MYKISLLNFEQLTIAALKSNNPDLLLYGINYPEGRPLQIYIHGTVAEAPFRTPQEFGNKLQFRFRPQIEDINSFIELENILTKDPEAARLLPVLQYAGIDIKQYTQRSVLGNGCYLTLKLNTDKKGVWRFYSDEQLLVDNLDEQMKQGTPITVTLNSGFYFDKKDKKFGLYFNLQEMLFSPGKPTDPQVKAFLEQNEQVRKSTKGKKTTIKVR